MRMTSTGVFPRALAAARPPKPPPTITTRGVFDFCSSAPSIELRLASFIYLFLNLLRPEISENLRTLVVSYVSGFERRGLGGFCLTIPIRQADFNGDRFSAPRLASRTARIFQRLG